MTKKFSIHDWQAKQRLAEQDDYQKRQDALTPGKNPDAFYGPDSFIGKMKSQESMSNADIKSLQTKIQDFDQEDPRMDPAVRSDFDDPIMDEQNTTGGGASFNAGTGEGYMTPNAFKKNKKQ